MKILKTVLFLIILLANIKVLANNIVFGYLHLKVHFYFKSRPAGIGLLMPLTSVLVKGLLATSTPQEPFF